MILGGLYRRKGKLAFHSGDIAAAREFYKAGMELLRVKYPYCLDFGELMNNYAML